MGELERSLTHREFLEWRVIEHLHPFGPLGDDARFAALIFQVANMLRGKDDQAVMPWQLMPWLDKPSDAEPAGPAPSPQQVSNNVLKFFSSNWSASHAPPSQSSE